MHRILLTSSFLLLVQLIHRPVQAFRIATPSPGISRVSTIPPSSAVLSNDDNIQDLGQQRVKIGDQEFWAKQKAIAQEITAASEKSLRQEQLEKYQKRSRALVGETAYISFFLFCALWILFDNPFVAFSYSIGATMGVLYSYGLGKYVSSLGGSVDDTEDMQGAGIGGARFAFLILLFVIVGKFRGDGLQEIPAISGFFTYQLASLTQGLREISD